MDRLSHLAMDMPATPYANIDDLVADLIVDQAADVHRLAAWILRDPVGAEDAVQEAALTAWNRRASLRKSDAAQAWFKRIVINTCRDELRRRARVRPLDRDEGFGPSHADRLDDKDELESAVARLTPDEQVVLGLRFGRDLTVPQIASATGLPEGTVKSRLHHSLEHLRAAIAAERRAEGSPR
jgi:RNA polymerase sigma factor (sigma-70 family)